MDGNKRLAIVMDSVAKGVTSPQRGVELVVQIFGDEYDKARQQVMDSFNPPAQIKPAPSKCYCGACGEGFVKYDLGGES